MRTIKFKGKDLIGNWHYGHLCVISEKSTTQKPGSFISNSVGMPFAYPVRPETVCQFTGRIDKNGTAIYNNDILQGPSDSSVILGPRAKRNKRVIQRFLVKWDANFMWGGWSLEPLGEIERTLPKFEECEVIGNIHNNPER